MMGLRYTPVGERFEIVEARSSSAAKHEGAEVVPFTRSRNRAIYLHGETGAELLS